MSHFRKLLSPSATALPALATAYHIIVNEIDGIAVNNAADLAYVHRRVPYISATFIPQNGRNAIVESLDRLSLRVARCQLPDADVGEVVKMIKRGIRKIWDQPARMWDQSSATASTPEHNGDVDSKIAAKNGGSTESEGSGIMPKRKRAFRDSFHNDNP